MFLRRKFWYTTKIKINKMRKIFENVFYFFYFYNVGIMDEKDWEKVLSTVMVMTIVQLLNLMVLIVLPTFIGIDTYSLIKSIFTYKYNILFFALVILLINYLYFWSGKRYKKIVMMYSKIWEKRKRIRIMLVLSYCLISVLLFFITIFSVSL